MYKNPFADYRSDTLSSEDVFSLFAEPFNLLKIDESEIKHRKTAIVFVGGRGTGKTMLLRQYSFYVQKIKNTDMLFGDQIKKDGYLGVYFRIDDPFLKAIDSIIIEPNNTNNAESIFTHYFELFIFKEYLEVVKLLIKDNEVLNRNQKNIIQQLVNLLHVENKYFGNIDELLDFVVDQLRYIQIYRSKKAIDVNNKCQFSPECGLCIQGQLTNGFVRSGILSQLGLENIQVLLLLDEFESFSESQQKVINTAMRFTNENAVSFRIGMRPNGFKTHETTSKEDFIKIGRDYEEIKFDNPILYKGKNKPYIDLIETVATKRLKRSEMFRKFNIKSILGDDEDLETEAKSIVNHGTRHLEFYLSKINANRKTETEWTIKDLESIRDDNPLYEMTCLRLLLEADGYVNNIDRVSKALHDFKNKIKSVESKKFENDYKNKYKLSFIFILSSIYKKERKLYYGFKDFCLLSFGIVGYFMLLCKIAFDRANFTDFKKLEQGKISPEVQTAAAYDLANDERNMISRIPNKGRELLKFIDNVGNAFNYLHSELEIRYPETNQFIIKQMNDSNNELFDTACKYSLIMKKRSAQDLEGKNQKKDVYVLNRVYAPFYKISCRTRGGFNPVIIDDNYFVEGYRAPSVFKDESSYANYQITLGDLLTETSNVDE